MSRDEGAATALAVGVAAALLVVLALTLPFAVLVAAAHRAAAAADAAALAAGDTALGLVVGVPCDRARQVADAGGARLAACLQRGDLVRVRVVVDALGATVPADAVAGPAPSTRSGGR